MWAAGPAGRGIVPNLPESAPSAVLTSMSEPVWCHSMAVWPVVKPVMICWKLSLVTLGGTTYTISTRYSFAMYPTPALNAYASEYLLDKGAGWGYTGVRETYSPTQSVVRYLNYYRECAHRMYGYRASSNQIGWSTPVYISDTDQKARDEAKPHIEVLFNRLLRLPFEMIFPPGYLSAKSLKNMRSHKRSVSGQEHTIDSLIEQGIIVCGSPDTVRKQFMDTHRLLGFQNLLCLLQFGTLPRDLTEKNIRLFAREVLPALQGLTDKEYGGMEVRAAE